jgi:heat shock protein HslJ
MEGYSGCNWYGNGYRLRGGKGTYQLEVAGPAMSTARGCGPAASDLEKAFHDAIQRARRVVEQGNRLTLFDSSQTELLTLHRHIPYPVDLAELRRESWRLASPSSNSPSWSDPMDVTFADSTFEAISGCYQVRGEYRVAGDNFYVLAMGADASECASHRRDQVPPIPITGGKLSVDADRLILYDENGHATAFTRPS